MSHMEMGSQQKIPLISIHILRQQMLYESQWESCWNAENL